MTTSTTLALTSKRSLGGVIFPDLESKGIVLFRSKPANGTTTAATALISLVIVGSFVWVPVCVYFAWKKCKGSKKRKVIFFCIIIVLSYYPIKESRLIRRNIVWDKLYEYFSVTAVAEEALDKKKRYMFAVFPHGVFPWSVGAAAVGELGTRVFNRFRTVVASSLFRFPFMRQIIAGVGAIEATEKSITAALKQGDSIGVAPGGIGEMFWGYPRPGCLPDEEYVLCADHKGFVRLAIKHGLSLVPVYCFGNSKALHRGKIPLWVENLSRYLKISIVFFWGRWFLPIPYKVPLLFAIGKPIDVVTNPHPTQQEIDMYHKQFCDALVALFNKYKDTYGWSHKVLKIV